MNKDHRKTFMMAEGDEARAQVAALREALSSLIDVDSSMKRICKDCGAHLAMPTDLVSAVLADTDKAAETYRKKYKRELLAAAPKPDPEDMG